MYYNGHGIFDGKREHLEISASNEEVSGTDNNARASWNSAELSLIQDVDCDVLSILDCCFASNMQQHSRMSHSEEVLNAYFDHYMRRDTRPDPPIYELLTAAGPGLPTSSAPKHSFTGRLIHALNHFAALNKPFSTYDLNQRIVANSKGEAIPCLFNRVWSHAHWNARHIPLERLVRSAKRQNSFNANPTKAYLTLQFALKTDNLSQDQIKDLAKRMTKACKEKSQAAESPTVGIRQIDWISLRSSARPDIRHTIAAINGAKRWRRNTVSRKQSAGGTISLSPSPSPSPGPARTSLEIPQVPRLDIPPSPSINNHEHSPNVTVTPSITFVLFGFAFEIFGVFALLVVIIAVSLYGSGLERSPDWH